MNKILFRDFVAHYMSNFMQSFDDFSKAEPLVITISNTSTDIRFLFTAQWSVSTYEKMKMFVSPEIYNAHVDKFYLTDEGRIGVTLTWDREGEDA